MRKTFLVASALSVMVMVLATPAFAPPPTYPPDLDLSASVWQILNPDTSATLHNDAGGGLYFDFPVEPDTSCTVPGDGIACDYVNYLFTDHVPSSVSGMLSIRMRVDVIENSPVFHHTEFNTPCTNNPPAVRAMIWGNTNLSFKGRWWSRDIRFALEPGTVTLNIPIDPTLWSGINGQPATEDMADWTRTITNTKRLAVTFGGGCAFGHGIFTTGGTARFTIENYEVTAIPNCPSVQPCNGSSCITSTEIGSTSNDLYQCVQPGGSLMSCDPAIDQIIHTVSTNCQKAPCCTAQPFPCVCSIFPCPGGTSLQCRTNPLP